MFIIAIDGPAGSGKSTTAKAVAKDLGFVYLDTGAMYRAITWRALLEGAPLAHGQGLARLAAATSVSFREQKIDQEARQFVVANGVDVTADIRTPSVTAAVSQVAAHPEVREVLVKKQREYIACAESKGAVGAVVEGRDIGTVVFPEAPLKIFLDASLDIRGERRAKQLDEQGVTVSSAASANDLQRRDTLDSSRDVSPLVAAVDAIHIDTGKMSQAEQASRVTTMARERLLQPAPRTINGARS